MTSPENVHVSDALVAYASFELSETRRAEVDAHLAICEGCSQELVGLMALRASDFEPMTGPERERVTLGVRAAATERRPGVLDRWGRRLAPAFGAAALVVVAVVGYVSFNDGERSSPAAIQAPQETAPETVEDDAARGAGQETLPSQSTAGAAESQGAESLEMEAGTAVGNAADSGSASDGVIPVVQGDRFSLSSLGEDLFSARRMRDSFRSLSGEGASFAANDPDTSATMDTCAQTVIGTSPYAVVPAYAAHFIDDDIILIAFVWRDSVTGTMNFLVRGWRGGDCRSVSPIYRTGPL